MTEKRSLLNSWLENNQDANLAFTLVAKNEIARQMWADPHNASRYLPPSFTRRKLQDPHSAAADSDDQSKAKKQKGTEPALQFLFDQFPKNIAKGFVLGTDEEACDVLLGDPGDYINKQVIAFNFNKNHQLIMNVISDDPALVTFNEQKPAKRTRFSWIFPRGQRKIKVTVASIFDFEVVLPKYGRNTNDFHDKCESFLASFDRGDVQASGLINITATATKLERGTSESQDPFYLRGKKVGEGSYGDVYQCLSMPHGEIVAAKEFKCRESFNKEFEMLKKVSQTQHENIVQFVGEWDQDFKPMLIMEYVVGGDLRKQIEDEMGYGQITNFAEQTLTALAFIHERNIMHRDLKPENIFCAGPNLYKLGDFGLSREVSASASRQGTNFYMAPEVDGSAFYDFKADLWSLGVILAECVNGLPKGGPNLGQVRRWCRKVLRYFEEYYVECERAPQMSSSTFFALIHLVKTEMLIMKPEERGSAQDCLDLVPELWEAIFQEEDFDPAKGAITQAHSDGSFDLSPLGDSKDEGSNSATSVITVNERSSPVDAGSLYDPARVEPWPSIVSDN